MAKLLSLMWVNGSVSKGMRPEFLPFSRTTSFISGHSTPSPWIGDSIMFKGIFMYLCVFQLVHLNDKRQCRTGRTSACRLYEHHFLHPFFAVWESKVITISHLTLTSFAPTKHQPCPVTESPLMQLSMTNTLPQLPKFHNFFLTYLYFPAFSRFSKLVVTILLTQQTSYL